MTRLVPVTGVLGVLAEVEKRDPDAAQMLAQFGLFEALGDLVDAARPRLDRMVSKAMRARADEGRRALVRAYVSKRASNGDVGQLVEAAYGLTGIEVHIAKAYDPHERRDPATGRWVKDLPNTGNQDEMQLAATRAIESWRRAGVVDAGTKVQIVGRDTKGRHDQRSKVKVGQNHQETYENVLDNKGKISHPLQVSVHEQDTNRPGGNRRLAYDAIAGSMGPGPAQRAVRGAPIQSGDQFGRELDNLTRDSDLSEGDRRAYRQIGATGRALRAVSAPGSTTHVAGGVAQLVGELGPQAERVLGPGIRRTAYRYRGTERQPSTELVNEVSSATPMAAAVAEGDTDAIRAQADTQLSARPPGDSATSRPQRSGAGLAIGSAMSIAGRTQREDLSQDQVEMRLRGDTALGYLNRKVATPERTALSIAAGRVPPSQGVVIDRNGDVVTEAMGAGSDHYLPFDLKNLKRLQGGQYARTRAAGGPTTEDMYTGLMTGARQLQVISNSGVFTVEFDENLRGGRRYSDKARQMIGRYEKLLSTVESGDHYAQDIPDTQRRQIERDVYDRVGYDNPDAPKIVQREVNEARMRAQIEGDSDEDLEEKAKNEVLTEVRSGRQKVGSTGQLHRLVQDRTKQLIAEQKDERVRRLQLDGEGYAKALESLQEEFPYFIRNVEYETRQDFVRNRRMVEPDQPLPSGSPRAKDKGYVRPGYRNVTAFDQHGSRSNSTSSTSASGGSGGEGRGGGPGESSRTATAASNARGQGGKLLNPIRFKPEPANKLSELGGPELQNRLANSLDNASELINMPANNLPGDAELKDPSIAAGTPVTFVRTLTQKHGGLRNTAQALKDAPAEHIDSFIRGLSSLSAEADDLANAGDTGYRDRAPKASVDEAIKNLQLLKTSRNPYVNYTDDPATYLPENPRTAAPQHFDEIDELGDRADNYSGFHEQARKSDPALASAIDQLSPHRPEDRGQIVAAAVSQYKATLKWAEMGERSPKPQGVPSGISWKQARNIAEEGTGGKTYKSLHSMQGAWAFLHGRDAATALGGGAAPKAPAPSAPTQQTPAPPGPVVFQGAGTKPVTKRGPHRVVVHPPGSTVAKAFQQAISPR